MSKNLNQLYVLFQRTNYRNQLQKRALEAAFMVLQEVKLSHASSEFIKHYIVFFFLCTEIYSVLSFYAVDYIRLNPSLETLDFVVLISNAQLFVKGYRSVLSVFYDHVTVL